MNGPQASVDLGSVTDVFYDHNINEKISFELKWDTDFESQIENGEEKQDLKDPDEKDNS